MHIEEKRHRYDISHLMTGRPVRRILAVSALGLMLLPIGCTATGAAQSSPHVEYLKAQLRQVRATPKAPTQRAELIFAQLKLDKALLNDDPEGILDAVDRLLMHSHGKFKLTSSAPIIDAAIWLLAHEMEDEAFPLVQRASVLLPDDLPLIALQADLLIQQNEREAAIALLKDFAKAHPDDVQAQAELALAQLRSGQTDDAMAGFANIPEKDLTPIIRFAYAQALNVAGYFSESEKQLSAAVHEEPEYAEAWQLLALTKEELGKKQEARAIYRDLLKTDPENRSARLFLIRQLLADNDMESATQTIAEASDPLHFSVASAAMLMDEQDFEKAEQLLKMLEGRPSMPDGLYFYHAALLYEGDGDLTLALDLLQKVTETSAEYDKALRMKMRILYEMKRFDEAVISAETLYNIHPDEIEPLLNLAELYTNLNRLDDAERTLKAALKLEPENESAMTQYAYLHELLGKRAEAMTLMENVITVHPNNAFALNYVGYNLADKGKELDRATELIRRAVELEPKADFIIDSLAWALYRRGEFAEAWSEIQKVVDLSDTKTSYDPTMLEHYGDIASAVGETDAASEAWKRSMETFQELGMTTDAERVLRKLEKRQ